jgi:hypothetical protein
LGSQEDGHPLGDLRRAAEADEQAARGDHPREEEAEEVADHQDLGGGQEEPHPQQTPTSPLAGLPQHEAESRRHRGSHQPSGQGQSLPDPAEAGEIEVGQTGSAGPDREAPEAAAEQQGRKPVPHLMGQRGQQEERPGEVPAIGDQIQDQRDGGAHQEHFARHGIRLWGRQMALV